MKSGIITIILVSSIINSFCAEPAKVSIPTRINPHQYLDDLSIDDLLAILSVGKLRALTYRTDIKEKLMMLEADINSAFERFYNECVAQKYLSEEQLSAVELEFKQKMALALYAILYAEVQKRITAESTAAQKIIFDAQLKPDELDSIVTQ